MERVLLESRSCSGSAAEQPLQQNMYRRPPGRAEAGSLLEIDQPITGRQDRAVGGSIRIRRVDVASRLGFAW